MRGFAGLVGIVLLLGGVALGFVAANHYYSWVELPTALDDQLDEMLVTTAPAQEIAYEETTLMVGDGAEPADHPDAKPKPMPMPMPEPEAAAGAVEMEPPFPVADVMRREAAKPPPPSASPIGGLTAKGGGGAVARSAPQMKKSEPRRVAAAMVETPPVQAPPEPAAEQLPWGVKHPTNMAEGSRAEVQLVIDATSERDPTGLLAGTSGTLTTGSTKQATTYSAQLSGDCFTVEPHERVKVGFTTDVPMLWTWTATATRSGDDCSLLINLGSIVDDALVPLRLERIVLPVSVASKGAPLDLLGLAGPLDDILSLLAAMTTLVGGLLAWLGLRKR